MGKIFLVVDDCHDCADCMLTILEICGQIAFCAYDGRSAVEFLRSQKADFVLLDLKMPVFDGFATLAAIRELEGGRDIWVAAHTGWAHPAVRDRAREVGFDHFFVKPIGVDELLAELMPLQFARNAVFR